MVSRVIFVLNKEGLLEQSLKGTVSRMAAVEQEINEVNERMKKIFLAHDLRRFEEFNPFVHHPTFSQSASDSYSSSYESESEESSYSHSESDLYACTNSF